MHDLLVRHIGQLILPSSTNGPLKGRDMSKLQIVHDAAIAVKEGKITWTGSDGEAALFDAETIINAEGKVVSPALVDPHTHLVFGGSREQEMVLKQAGVSYMDILSNGGGILSTARATKAATPEQLFEKAQNHLNTMLAHGVGTVEAKSGYGLDKETELKQLRTAKQLHKKGPVRIVSTFLGPHALPKEYKDQPGQFIEEMIRLLPVIQSEGLAEFADIFCEPGAFTVEQSRMFLKAAAEKGFQLKIHADELEYSGGTELAASLGAASADHLVAVSEKGIRLLAEGSTVAVLLPGTSLYLNSAYAPARKIIDAGGAAALATDFNPGSSVTENLQLIMSIAALKLRMSAEEIWNAVTVNAAYAIGREREAGTLDIGRRADFVIWNIPNYQYLPYHYGINHAAAVYLNGREVWGEAVNLT